MSETESFAEKRRKVKQDYIRRKISQGRGAEAIRKIDALYRNVRDMWNGTDDDVVGQMSSQLTNGAVKLTLKELDDATEHSIGKYVRAFNMQQAMIGSPHRLNDMTFAPGTPTLN